MRVVVSAFICATVPTSFVRQTLWPCTSMYLWHCQLRLFLDARQSTCFTENGTRCLIWSCFSGTPLHSLFARTKSPKTWLPMLPTQKVFIHMYWIGVWNQDWSSRLTPMFRDTDQKAWCRFADGVLTWAAAESRERIAGKIPNMKISTTGYPYITTNNKNIVYDSVVHNARRRYDTDASFLWLLAVFYFLWTYPLANYPVTT